MWNLLGQAPRENFFNFEFSFWQIQVFFLSGEANLAALEAQSCFQKSLKMGKVTLVVANHKIKYQKSYNSKTKKDFSIFF